MIAAGPVISRFEGPGMFILSVQSHIAIVIPLGVGAFQVRECPLLGENILQNYSNVCPRSSHISIFLCPNFLGKAFIQQDHCGFHGPFEVT